MLTKIIAPKDCRALAEINQTINVKFSFAAINEDNSVTQKHELVKCRDFLGDVVYTNKKDHKMQVYSFVANKERIPLEKELQLLVSFPTRDVRDSFMKNYVEILHSVESNAKLKQTEILKIKGKPSTIVLVADPFWQTSIPAISLYSFLLKASSYEYKDVKNWLADLNDRKGIESDYIKCVKPEKIQKLLDNIANVLLPVETATGFTEEKEKTFTNYTIHDGCGFVNTFKGHNKHNIYSNRFWSI